MKDSFIQSAFDLVCKVRPKGEGCFVVLMEETSFYGGPEEGGWWGHDQLVRAYKHYPSRELADATGERIKMLAQELSAEAKKVYGEQCLRETEWLDARGLDDNFLPEPDGESTFYVIVDDHVPEDSYGCRHYE